jgi:hypothetical protein
MIDESENVNPAVVTGMNYKTHAKSADRETPAVASYRCELQQEIFFTWNGICKKF